MKELNCSRVKFDSNAHTYEVDGKNLNGVTPIVNWVFGHTYDGIPDYVLKQAADHGSAVHKACEMADSTGIVLDGFDDVVYAYQNLKDEAGLEPMLNEYLVDLYDSDYLEIASSIDVVFVPAEDGRYPLADIKTTSKLHIPNVTLQLSIYAMMFEAMNEGKQAGRLFAIWLPKPQYGKPALVEVQRIPTEKVWEIINEYRQGGDPDACARLVGEYVAATPATTEDWLPANIAEVEKEIVRIENEQKAMEARSKELRAGLLQLMQKYDKDNWEGEHIILTRRKATTRMSLDTTKVKAQFPEVFEACKKESKVSESLTIKIK